MYIDLVGKDDEELVKKVKNLGFDSVFYSDKGVIKDCDDKLPFEIKLYGGKDYDFVIKKGKTGAITDLDKNGVLLNKGLCSKLKENEIFVIFKFKSLVDSEEFFRTYKNFLINARLCNDYSVPALFVSFAAGAEEIKSPAQLVAFAETFGYNYSNYKKSVEFLSKRK